MIFYKETYIICCWRIIFTASYSSKNVDVMDLQVKTKNIILTTYEYDKIKKMLTFSIDS